MKLSNKHIVIILITMTVTAIGLKAHQTFFSIPSSPKEPFVTINDTKIKVEIADTPEKKIKGLSNRESLATTSGMLFVFEDSNYRNFWMKEMKFPIDIIWINNSIVVGIDKNAPTPTIDSIPVFKSPRPIDAVLEVNANITDSYGIKEGDVIKYSLY